MKKPRFSGPCGAKVRGQGPQPRQEHSINTKKNDFKENKKF